MNHKGRGGERKVREIIFEMLLILILSLLISLTYNAISTTGIRVLPKKTADEKTGREKTIQGNFLLEGKLVIYQGSGKQNVIRF